MQDNSIPVSKVFLRMFQHDMIGAMSAFKNTHEALMDQNTCAEDREQYGEEFENAYNKIERLHNRLNLLTSPQVVLSQTFVEASSVKQSIGNAFSLTPIDIDLGASADTQRIKLPENLYSELIIAIILLVSRDEKDCFHYSQKIKINWSPKEHIQITITEDWPTKLVSELTNDVPYQHNNSHTGFEYEFVRMASAIYGLKLDHKNEGDQTIIRLEKLES